MNTGFGLPVKKKNSTCSIYLNASQVAPRFSLNSTLLNNQVLLMVSLD